MQIIDISSLIFFLRMALEKTLEEKVSSKGTVKDCKNLGTKENRLFFNIDSPLSMGLQAHKNGFNGYSYQGQGTLTFYYPQQFLTSSALKIKETSPFYDLKSEKIKKEASISFQFSLVNMNYEPSQEWEWGGYMLEIPFFFNATLYETEEEAGEIKTFEITQNPKKEDKE